MHQSPQLNKRVAICGKDLMGWSLDAATKNAIDRIRRELVSDPVGPEFMAPPARSELRPTPAAAFLKLGRIGILPVARRLSITSRPAVT